MKASLLNFVSFFALILFGLNSHGKDNLIDKDWKIIIEQARNKTVFFNAWGGSQNINSYIKWASVELKERYGVNLKHVKVTDIAETNLRLIAEKASGITNQGSVDLVWINGENFRSMKQNDLLFGPLDQKLPNWQYLNESLPIATDFTEPTDGLEAPWGVGQFVFIYDTQRLKKPPENFKDLLILAKNNPGKITYPKPPEFHGTSFLKSVLIELARNSEILYKPIKMPNDKYLFKKTTQPLWEYLDQLHPLTWKNGKQFPNSSSQTIQLLDDQQLLMAIAFNPNAAEAEIINGTLPGSAKTFALKNGALTNIHYLAIPWNSAVKEAALVCINFFMSPEAQTRKSNTKFWGDPSVLKTEVLNKNKASYPKLFKAIPEPHPTWLTAIEDEWQIRYGH